MRTCIRCGYVPACDDTRDAMVEQRRKEIDSLNKRLAEADDVASLFLTLYRLKNKNIEVNPPTSVSGIWIVGPINGVNSVYGSGPTLSQALKNAIAKAKQ